ncbi:hypothetical protein ACWFQ8_01695 [Streptomyces sp. NPDC055254]
MSNGPAWLAAGAATAGAGAAWFAAVNGVRTLRQTRTDSINRSRPMVTAELRDAYPAEATLYLVIRNNGPSVARNVKVTFSPEIPDPTPEKSARSLIPFLKDRYAQLIPTLTPGTEYKNIYFAGTPGPDDQFINSENVPDQVTVTIDYESSDGKFKYKDSYHLDIELMKGETRVTSSRSLESRAKEINRALQGIKGAADKIARQLAKED